MGTRFGAQWNTDLEFCTYRRVRSCFALIPSRDYLQFDQGWKMHRHRSFQILPRLQPLPSTVILPCDKTKRKQRKRSSRQSSSTPKDFSSQLSVAWSNPSQPIFWPKSNEFDQQPFTLAFASRDNPDEFRATIPAVVARTPKAKHTPHTALLRRLRFFFLTKADVCF